MDELIREQLVRISGPKGKHDPGRSARRHGGRRSKAVLGGRKVSVRRPRARTTDGEEARLWDLGAISLRGSAREADRGDDAARALDPPLPGGARAGG
jgi:hypothetical protein